MKSLFWKEQFIQGNFKPFHISCTKFSPQKWIFERVPCCVFDILLQQSKAKWLDQKCFQQLQYRVPGC